MRARSGFLAAALALGLVTACAPSPESEREAITRELLAHPDSRAGWEAIRQHYPAEFGKLVERIRALDPDQREGGSRAMRRVVEQWQIVFFRAILADASNASARKLRDLVRTDMRLMETLAQENLELCGIYNVEGTVRLADENGMPKSRAALGEWNAASVLAAAEGRERPVRHAEPTQAEFDRVGQGLIDEGIPVTTIQSIGDAAKIRKLSSRESCDLGLALRRAILRLPEDAVGRMIALQMKEQVPADQRRSANTRR